jgi:PAT family beta-lactamase induction signal transducer AmpG
MAGVMLVGVATTLLVPEPEGAPASRNFGGLEDYLRFLAVFLVSVGVFVAGFILFGRLVGGALGLAGSGGEAGLLVSFLSGALRLAAALGVAFAAARLAVLFGLVRQSLLEETYVEPLADFFRRYGRLALLVLALIGLYRVSDIVLGVISNVFYQDLGFTKHQIADITKTFGLVMTIVGGFLGGGLALRYGVMRILFLGAVLSAATNLLFMLLAQAGPEVPLLVVVIAADNLSAGLASAAFVAYLSGLTQVAFTAVQYAVFSSLMTLLPKLFGGYSGSIVDSLGYGPFFLLTAGIGLPVLLLVWAAARYAPVDAPARAGGG